MKNLDSEARVYDERVNSAQLPLLYQNWVIPGSSDIHICFKVQIVYGHREGGKLLTPGIARITTQAGYYKDMDPLDTLNLNINTERSFYGQNFVTGCTGNCQNNNFQCSQWPIFPVQ